MPTTLGDAGRENENDVKRKNNKQEVLRFVFRTTGKPFSILHV